MSKKAIISVFATLSFTLSSGCAIVTRIPANRFDSPETQGKLWAGEFGGGLEGGNQYVITDDDTFVPPNFNNASFEHSNGDGFLNGNLGTLSHLDLGVKLRFNSVFLLQAKYQILGEPRATAKVRNFSWAFTAAAGSSDRESTDTNAFSSVTAKNSITESAIDFATILGYRFGEKSLVYAGASWTRQTYSGTLTQTPSGGSATDYPYSGRLRQTGFNIGIETGVNRLVARLEYGGAFTDSYDSGISTFGGYAGGELGFYW